MWEYIRLQSLGVIEEAELELGPGFTVITGETGAGKTMVVTALSLLRGQRADPAMVRHGAKAARIEARVHVGDSESVRSLVDDVSGDIEDDTVLLSRVVSAQGRSRAYVGGAPVPAANLAEVSDALVAVHGQSDQYRLLKPATHRQALDRFAGGEIQDLLASYRPLYARLKQIGEQLQELRTHSQERARELDLLTFGLDEIGAVDPVREEDQKLSTEENRLAHAESLARAAQTAHDRLLGDGFDNEGAQHAAADAARVLHDVGSHDDSLDELAGRVSEAALLLAEVGADLGAYATDVELQPQRLATVQERQAAIAGLQRKYGPTLDDVIQWAEAAAVRSTELSGDDDRIGELEAEADEAESSARKIADQLTVARTSAALKLGAAVNAEVHALSMAHARLTVEVTPAGDPQRLGLHGHDHVEFLFAANNGATPRPLNKGASGGELSRLMLALEVVLVDQSTVPTLVFDEVDAGIGGKAAVEVGRRLARLAEHAQVVAVTHLPQVAAFADHHFLVVKDDDGNVTSSSVEELSGERRVDELSRMLAGLEDSQSAQAHARELLELARR